MEAIKSLFTFGLILLLGIMGDVTGQNITSINPGNGVDRGEWGAVAYCPPGTYAAEMELKYESRGNVDDTCANAVKLYCEDDTGFFFGYVTSSEGEDGSYQGIKSCPEGSFIIGYAMRVEGLVGNFDDDLGVINVRVECDDGTILEGVSEAAVDGAYKNKPPKRQYRDMEHKPTREEIEKFVNLEVQGRQKRQSPQLPYKNLKHTLTPEEIEKFSKREGLSFGKKLPSNEDGTWGPLATCPIGYRVCGLQTQVEPVHLVDDDAGLCDMNFLCCSV